MDNVNTDMGKTGSSFYKKPKALGLEIFLHMLSGNMRLPAKGRKYIFYMYLMLFGSCTREMVPLLLEAAGRAVSDVPPLSAHACGGAYIGSSITLSDFRDAEDAGRIRKAEQELAAISDSIGRHKALCEEEAEKSRQLAESTKDMEKIRRQEKKVLRAEENLAKEESRYQSAAEALEAARSTKEPAQSGEGSKTKNLDAASAMSQIESCLERIESCPGLLAGDDGLLEFLENISGRFFSLLEDCRKVKESGNICQG